MRTLLAAVLVVLAVTGRAGAAVPNGFVDELVASGLSAGTAMAFAPDGRLFVCQQTGAVRVIKNGALLAQPFITLPVNSAGERGVLGIAFDPAFAANGYVYLHYTTSTAPIHNRVIRVTASGDLALPGSAVTLIDMNPLSSATNHNGGGLAFRADGTLLIAVGENANGSNAQTLSNLLGKMLRINSDGTIPTDNPFYGTATGVNRAIWAYGLRNPFTFGIQPGTGRIFLNDVGQNTWEEIDDGIAGANYGWPLSEGQTATVGQTGPLYSYGHGTGPFLGCAIAGGAFYEAATTPFPATYDGDYFFADLCGGWINRRDTATGTVSTFATGISNPVDIDVSPSGALYYLARGTNAVHRIRYVPPVVQSLTRTSTGAPAVGLPVTWTATATGVGTLEYRFWLFNPATQAWTGTAYSTARIFTFTPTTTGEYAVQVWARNVGSTDDWESYASTGFFTVTTQSALPSTPTLTASPRLPVVSGTVVTWSAAASGGRQPTQYQFWLLDPVNGWRITQPWSAASKWTWRPERSGTYAVQVWVRSAGSTAQYETWRSSGSVTVTAGPVRAFPLEPDRPRPFAPGTTVRWTQPAAGGSQPLEYRFWAYDGANWTMIRDYDPDNTVSWNAGSSGTKALQGWVRRVGSTASYESWTGTGLFQVAPSAVTLTLKSTQVFPLPASSPIVFTAVGAGGSAPLEFRFILNDGQAWTVVQDWSTLVTWSWTPTTGEAGSYTLQVWARSTGQPTYEAWTGRTFTIAP